MEYEYEAAMEKHYRSSLLKAFRKTVNDGYFPFIIVDCVNHQVKHFEEMWSYAKQKGFQVLHHYRVLCFPIGVINSFVPKVTLLLMVVYESVVQNLL
jgi:hypothetical protein